MSIHPKFILRLLKHSPKQGVVFALCVMLSLVTLVAINGFSRNVHRSMLSDARKLHAGDIIIRSYDTISTGIANAVAELTASGQVAATRYHEFYSVVRADDKEASLLADVKMVEKDYPFYGEVELRSGRSFHDVLAAGTAVVERNLLDRLGLSVGDRLAVGYTTLTIGDVVSSEPDRPVNVFSFGPRVFVSALDMDAINLIQRGSRIRRVVLLKVFDEKQLDPMADRLRALSSTEGERVNTFRTARSRVNRFLDDFLFFLRLVALFILVVSGIGIQSACSAFIREKRQTIAVIKTMGATNRFIFIQFSLAVVIIGLAGTALGTGMGMGLQLALARMLTDFLPSDFHLSLSGAGIIEGLILGIVVVGLFSIIPLSRLWHLKPAAIFRHESAGRRKGWSYYAALAAIGIFFFSIVLWHMEDIKFGAYFALGLSLLVVVTFLITQGVLKLLRKWRFPNLVLRQAAKGLNRPGNATRAIVVTLSAAICVIFSIYLLEENLEASFIASYPEDAPNLYFLDIQPDQREGVSAILNQAVKFYPIIRARLTAINDEKIDRAKERKKRRDNLSRVFNLTYREELLPDERLMDGKTLFRPDWDEVQVSVLDTVLEMRKMRVGDRITFRIQGVPLEARISSIRTRTRETMSPFFYFVFPEAVLKDAPQTIFTAAKVSKDRIAQLQTSLSSQFPNISSIDLSQAVSVFAGLMKRLSGIIRLFALLSIVAGILIMVSTIFATRAERIAESVYFKICGARQGFILKVMTLENLLIGAISAFTALILSHAGSFLICRYIFDIDYRPFLWTTLEMVGATLSALVLIALFSSRAVVGKRPAVFLRERQDG